MTITQKAEGKTLTVQPVGRMDTVTSDDFLAFVQDAFTADYDRLTLDFSGVDYISSKGIRTLLYICKHLDGRKMEITGANDAVLDILDITGFSEAFGVVR